MKLTVLGWFADTLKITLARVIEFTFRVILFLLPLGVFLTVLQYRSKVSKVSNLSVYTTDESVWQHIFPGFILVAIEPDKFKSLISQKKANFQNWIKSNQYWLAMLFMALMVALTIYFGKGL